VYYEAKVNKIYFFKQTAPQPFHSTACASIPNPALLLLTADKTLGYDCALSNGTTHG
jgi:hypothetical protein